jgi:flagellar motor switch protein FliN
MNMDLFGEAVGNIYNKSFSEYESITEPFFGIKSVTESIGIPAKGAAGQFQVAHMSFKVNNEEHEILVLFSLALTNVIKDKHLPATSATVPEMKDFSKMANKGGGAAKDNLEFLYDVPVEFTAVLGTTKKTIKEALNLGVGEVVVLDQYIDASVDLYLNNQCVGKGEVVVIDNHFAIKVVEIRSFNETKL